MPLDPVSTGDPHPGAHNAERAEINALSEAMPGKIDKPNSPTLGSLLVWDGDLYVPTQMRLFEGEGSPEGVISAPPGSRYIDATAVSGNAEYFKGSGEGNTGWVALNTSLPWTTITPGTGYAQVAGSSGQVSMLNGVVYFRGVMERTSGSALVVGTIPAEFRPVANINAMVRAAADWLPLTVSSAGNLTINSAIANGEDIYLGSFSGAPYRTS